MNAPLDLRREYAAAVAQRDAAKAAGDRAAYLAAAERCGQIARAARAAGIDLNVPDPSVRADIERRVAELAAVEELRRRENALRRHLTRCYQCSEASISLAPTDGGWCAVGRRLYVDVFGLDPDELARR